MVEHRRTPTRGAFVPASWLIVVALLACVGAAGWLGFEVLGDDSARADDRAAPATTTTAPPSPSESPSATPSQTTETPEPTEAPATERTSTVSVLNNTGVANLAATYATRVQSAGWTVAGTGNWRGQIPANTVYYPGDLEPQARLLADDLGIGRVLPSVSPMRTDRLTIILSGPQQ